MPFIVERLELQGFLGHRERTRLSLGPGVYALVGENGAGKSSVVDALRAALTLPRGLRVRDAEVVNNSSSRAVVDVVLANPSTGERLSVHIEKPREKPVSVVAEAQGPRGRVRATKLDDARRLIAEVLGLPAGDPGVLSFTSLVRQGGLEEILDKLSASPSQRRAFIEEILGVKDYARAVERLKSIYLDAEEGVKLNKEAPSIVGGRLERLREEARRLEERRARLEEDISKASRDLAAVEEKLRGLEEARSRAEKVREELANLEGEEAQLRERIAKAQSRLGELEEKASTLDALRRECERLRSLGALQGELMKLQVWRVELEGLEKQLERVKSLLEEARRLPELEEEAARYLEAQERLDKLHKEREKLLRELADVRAALEAHRRAERRIKAALEALSRTLEALGYTAPKDPRGALGEARRILGELAGEVEKLRARREELLAKAAGLRARAGELLEKAGILERSGAGRCPVCGAPLSPERARALASRYRGEAGDLRAEAERLEGEAERLAGKAGRLERAREGLSRALAALEEALEAAPQGDPREVEERLAVLEERLESLSKAVNELREEAERLRKSYSRLEALRRRLEEEAPEGLEALEALAERLEESARELRGRVEAALKRILAESGASSPEEAESIITKALAELEACSRRLGEAEEASRALAKARRELEELQSRLRTVEERVARLRGELRGLEGRLKELEALEDERSRLLRLKAELEGRLNATKERLEEVREKISRLEELYWRALKGKALLEVLERAPPLVLEAQLSLLSSYMTEALSRFGLDIVAASFKLSPGGVELVLTRSDGRRASVGELSGGEGMALALSFIIGLGRLHAIRAGFLVLDEPTANLDEERRRELVEVLRRVAGGDTGIPQLIIVTHDEDVAAAADEVCRVERVSGTSRVSCGG